MQTLNDESADGREERRHYVRVQDALGLHIQSLVELPAAGQPPTTQSSESVRKKDKYAIQGYAEVRKHYPDVAQYITDLEERIRELLLDGDELISKPTHKVSLSAGGLRFSDKALFAPGEMVSMTMTLFPSGQRIGTDAIIVAANEAGVLDMDTPRYHAEFIRISDQAREMLENHVNQLLAKRELLSD